MNKAKRTAVIAGNWKMNMTPSEAKKTVADTAALVAGKDGAKIILCVPFVDIASAQCGAEGSAISIGAQNVHFAEKGAFTGEISASMLKECGVEYVIIGHSERRQYFAETDETVNKRTKAALAAGLKVILCVGEVLEQRQSGITEEILSMQTKLDLAGLTADDLKNVIIRSVVAGLYGGAAAEGLTIQYGGSMNEKNAAELLAKENVDGGLIGGASLVPEKFAAIVDAAQA